VHLIVTTVGFQQTAVPELHADEGTKRRVPWPHSGVTANSPATTSAAGVATFYTTGMEHSPTSATGTGWERTPWHATQRAAWEALRKAE
jgi:hypothetical protein